MKLAINGGRKTAEKPFPDQITYEREEIEAVHLLMSNKKILSGYRGNWIPAFWGGEQVKKFEDQWSQFFEVPYCVAVNSCTSALQIACHAIGLGPGDEVIVTPWSMSCSATAPMVCNATPVFADIEPNNFCLDYDSVCEKITSKTKAIIAVSLFGNTIDPRLYDLAKAKSIYLIEDCAQAPGAWYENDNKKITFSGVNADIACFSFTQGKHLTCGEGGMIMTSNQMLAMNCALARNHAESVISAMPDEMRIDNKSAQVMKYVPGYNMRMTEINAVIMQEQLKKLTEYIIMRRDNANELYELLRDIDFIKKPAGRSTEGHAYYCQPFLFDQKKAEVHRDIFIKAVAAELTGEASRPDRPMLGCGYIQPLYRMPIFAWQDIFLPTVERLWKDDFFLSMYHNLPLSGGSIRIIADAFYKVAEYKEELKNIIPNEKTCWRNI